MYTNSFVGMLRKWKKLMKTLALWFIVACAIISGGLTISFPWLTKTPKFKFPSLLLSSTENEPLSEAIFTERLWHLDLKGAPPLISALTNWIQLAAVSGATGILVEWEDMFPYEKSLRNATALNAYSRDEVKLICETATKHDLKLIPLIQSLGHLEYILKLQEFRHLREIDISPGEACPSKPQTMKLIIEAIEEVLSLCPTEIIHIGGDEVFNIRECLTCKRKSKYPLELYVDYVENLAKNIKENWNLRILMWEDMLRDSITLPHVKKLRNLVEPVIWAYSEYVVDVVPTRILNTYWKVFRRFWVASAYKGSMEPDSVMTNSLKTFTNTLSWAKRIHRMKNVRTDTSIFPAEVSGIIVTGWSRFDHFAGICELHPPSIPSQILSLQAATGTPEEMEKMKMILKCPSNTNIDLQTDPYLWSVASCKFPEAGTLSLLRRFVIMKKLVEEFEQSNDVQGWITAYNLKNQFVAPIRLKRYKAKVDQLQNTLGILTIDFYKTFQVFYNNFTLNEWNDQNLVILQQRLWKLASIVKNNSLNNLSWKRRPFLV